MIALLNIFTLLEMAWFDLFDVVRQTGWDTGNNELQDYEPSQVSRHND
jgi:hypothetical protein